MGGCASKSAAAVERTATVPNSVTDKVAGADVSATGPPSLSNGSSAPAPFTLPHEMSNDSNGRPRFASYASGASTPEYHSDNDDNTANASPNLKPPKLDRKTSNPKAMTHSSSRVGLDTMIDERRETGALCQNVVHMEVPFGKPIEEVYDGVHSGPVLGSGISGLVRLVTHKATGLKYAVKVLDLALVDSGEGLTQLREEIFIMCQLDHPNIVRLEEVYESQMEIYLVQELCLGGELFDRLDEQPDYHYTEAECAKLVKQMLSAVRYLHSRGIIHRDLKLENFLFSSTSKDSELKMIDFGLSKHFRYGEVHHEAVGTPYTVAPEVIRGSYDEKCDIWAIGVITFLLLSGDPPFGGCGGPEPLMQVRENILNCNFKFEPADIWTNSSALAKTFIRDLLKTVPKDRPTAKEAQQHQWLQEWASRGRVGNDNILNPNVVKALVNFKEFSDMRKLLCEVLSFTLLPYQIRELRREFEKMDTDGSGEISLSALKEVLVTNAGTGSLGALTEEEVEDIFNAMRVRKTETRIHWHEFIAAGLSQCQVDDRNLRLAFDRLDSDHKGYIVLEDITDLLGSDAFGNEDAMSQMWGDGIRSVNCQHARITYDDFLLLMKGQSKESPAIDGATGSISFSKLNTGELFPVSESIVNDPEDTATVDVVQSPVESTPPTIAANEQLESERSQTPTQSVSATHPMSAPTTPSNHRKLIDPELESPASFNNPANDDDDIKAAGPGVAGSAASLTPPATPRRGVYDFITPSGARGLMDLPIPEQGLALPTLPPTGVGVIKPQPYVRGRSRSMDESEQAKQNNLHVVADAVRDMLLPESDHKHLHRQLEEVVKDESKSVLVVNRKLYRAHRQMRLAVLEASKRFEEQQADHARQVILAAREQENGEGTGPVMIQAGLVMRHGHTKQVSSQAIRTLLEENRIAQQALVEKANRRGGRGRKSRKKTTSDMTGMLSSLNQDEMTRAAMQAAGVKDPGEEDVEMAPVTIQTEELPVVDHTVSGVTTTELTPAEGTLRGATIPGEFRKTYDPFGSQGKYGLPLDD